MIVPGKVRKQLYDEYHKIDNPTVSVDLYVNMRIADIRRTEIKEHESFLKETTLDALVYIESNKDVLFAEYKGPDILTDITNHVSCIFPIANDTIVNKCISNVFDPYKKMRTVLKFSLSFFIVPALLIILSEYIIISILGGGSGSLTSRFIWFIFSIFIIRPIINSYIDSLFLKLLYRKLEKK